MRKRERAAKSFFKGFKDFITKGNIIDLAVGVIIGGAFGKIVSSLVNDVVMPPIGVLIGNVDFKDLVWIIKTGDEALGIAPVTINYGIFIMTIIEFLIIAFTIYIVLTLVIRRSQFKEKLAKEEQARLDALNPKEPEVVKEAEEILLLREIRDALKKESK